MTDEVKTLPVMTVGEAMERWPETNVVLIECKSDGLVFGLAADDGDAIVVTPLARIEPWVDIRECEECSK